jgi:UDP-glucose 4-epimerase
MSCVYRDSGRVQQVRIVITGGAGFIGSHVADAYLAAGHEVVVIDSLWSQGGGRRENVPERANFVHMDIRDEGLERVFRDFKPEIVSHHAAQHSVAISSRDPIYDAQVNVIGLIKLLDNCAKAKVRKIIFAGSGATYGEVKEFPITESTPQLPASPYGITKMAAEHYLRFYKSEYDLDFCSLRYGNVYGPRQDPTGEAGVIAIFINKFLAREGVRIDADGEQTRDYVYAGDVAQANVAALERGAGAYVIGTGVRGSVNDIYNALVEETGFRAPIAHAPRRAGDVRDAQFDAALARAELGWSPQTSLRDGIAKTLAYFRERAAV